LRHLHGSFFLLDLRARLVLLRQSRGNLCGRAVGIGFGHVERLLADYALLAETKIALVVGFGLHIGGPRLGRVGDCDCKICLGIFQIGPGLGERALKQRRVNLGDELACDPTWTVITALMVPVASTTCLISPLSTGAV
jgi:hypothetical protein